MAAGDVLLFSRKTTRHNFRRDPLGTLMTALIHLTTRSRWNHVSLDIGDGMMVEATSKGVAVNPIRSDDEITRIAHLPGAFGRVCGFPDIRGKGLGDLLNYQGNDLEETLAWATGRVGWRYGYTTAFFCGFRNVFPGWSIVQAKALICSQLVSEALERSGHDFGKSTEKVSPGDVAEHFGVPRK